MTDIVEKVRPVVNDCANKLNLELVDIEWVKEGGSFILRILADTEVGLTIDESANLNEMVGLKLDELNLIEEEYMLEVSSPGLEAPIKGDAAIEKAMGEYIFVKCYSAVDGVKEFYGYLKGFLENELTLEVNIKGRIRIVKIEKSNISNIRYAIKF